MDAVSPMPSSLRSLGPTQPLLFARHGATTANLAGLRCGGDLDLPLADGGREQARALARCVAALRPRIGLIVTSDLQRTRETASIVAAALGGVEIRVLPGWNERRLGAWNLQPIAQTQAALTAGLTPPGGEAEAEFGARIRAALQALQPLRADRPLLIGSKGVARVLGELAGLPDRLALGNTELVSLNLPWTAPPGAAAAPGGTDTCAARCADTCLAGSTGVPL